MTTIQASTQPIQTSGGSGTSSSNDIAAQISRILDKIKKLTQQLKELANSPGSADEKKKQQELIQTQTKVLQARSPRWRQQAEEAQEEIKSSAKWKVLTARQTRIRSISTSNLLMR